MEKNKKTLTPEQIASSLDECFCHCAPRKLCHICPNCLPGLLDELEVSMSE